MTHMVGVHDVVVQYLRFRVGDTNTNVPNNTYEPDSLWVDNSKNIMIRPRHGLLGRGRNPLGHQRLEQCDCARSMITTCCATRAIRKGSTATAR